MYGLKERLMHEAGYDPLRLGVEVEKHVARGDKRKYYRFRGGRWYGGIATADCVGCNLRCRFCWGWIPRDNYSSYGEFYSPREVYGRLVAIASRRGYRYVRVSGNEPTLAWQHLLELLELFEQDGRYTFILETNGIIIGADKAKARDLAGFKHLHVRVSLKGVNEDEFHRLTGARREFFSLQLKALENLLNEGVSTHPAVMLSFSEPRGVDILKERLREIDKGLADNLEEEYVFLYPHVVELMARTGLKPRVAYSPDGIPGDLV
ncbi:radical SAM protein [Desulfurococcus mucosus]|uniref:Radical SAM domain protein n=1 Tax=Desulfurococcus mucosus (strain ATCC 35584 / DSM 2162 / JCM 9187 / O7/1) TaxID=765177 RepID=E8RAH6_DESM0|nr:radical SAM protein [Desulfurococcus mucosus]ADV64386.1 Radical SAM domain protein [Desulfurococcus mucosus DSM 2162]